MPFLSIPAHFDGERVKFDEEVELEKDCRLIVTVLSGTDEERDFFYRLGAAGIEGAWGDDEVEYTEDDLIR